MLNIEFDLTKGNQQVDELGNKIVGLADKAETAAQSIRNALNFNGFDAAGLTALVAQFSALDTQMTAFKGSFAEANNTLKAFSGNTTRVAEAVKAVTEAKKAEVTVILQQAKAEATSREELQRTAKASQELSKADALAVSVKKQLISTTEARSKAEAELLSLVAAGKLGQEEYARAMALGTSAMKGSTTEVEKYLSSLKKQQEEFGKTSVQLLKLKAGYDLLTAPEKAAAEQAVKLQDSISRVGASINPVLGVVATYRQSLSDLLALKVKFVETEGKVGISETQYATALTASKKAVVDSFSALKTRAGMRDGEIAATARAKQALLDYLAGLEKETAGTSKASGGVTALMKAFQALGIEELKSADASRNYSNAMSVVGPLLKAQITPLQELEHAVDSLNLAFKEFKPASLGKEQVGINAEQLAKGLDEASARYLQNTKAVKENDSALISHLNSLKAQQAAWAKTPAQLLQMRDGWSQLTQSEQLSALELQKTSEAMARVEGLFTKALSPIQLYNQRVQDLTRLKREFSSSNGAAGLSEKQFAIALDTARRELNNSVAAYDKLKMAKTSTAQVTGMTKKELLSYIDALQKEAAELGKTEAQLARQSRAYLDLSTSEKIALNTAERYAGVTRTVAPLIQQQIKPIELYRQQLEALHQAQARFKPGSNGSAQVGINSSQFATGLNNAKDQLKANVMHQLEASRAAMGLASSFGVANQATNAFRAALMGANLGFGIFSSSTIVAATVAYTFSRALREALSVGSEFEATFERAAVVMGEFGNSADGTLGTLTNKAKLVKAEVLSLAESTQFGTVEVAKAAEVLAQAGLRPIQIFSALGPTLDLAAIGMIDVAKAADIAAGIMYGFGASAGDLEHIVDVMAQTVVMTNLNVEQVAKTMQYAAPVAHQLGMTFEDTAAAIAVLGNNAIKGSMAGTSLRNILLKTVATTPKAAKAFTDLGISVEKFAVGGRLNLKALFEELQKKGATVEQMKTIMGQWAISAALALRNDTELAKGSASGWKGYIEKLKEADGAAAEMAAGMRMNLRSAAETLTSTIESIGTQSFDIFGAEIEAQVRRLIQFLVNNSSEIVSVLSSVMLNITAIGSALVRWSGPITTFVASFTAFKLVQAILTTMTGVISILATKTQGLIVAKELEIEVNGTLVASNVALAESYVALSIGQNALKNGAAIQAATAASSVASISKQTAGLKGLSGALGVAGAFLTGWGGIILTLLAVAGPSLISWLSDVKQETYSTSEAFEKFKLIVESADDGLSGLEDLSKRALGSLAKDLAKGMQETAEGVEKSSKNLQNLAVEAELAKKSLSTAPSGASAMYGAYSQSVSSATNTLKDHAEAQKAHNALLVGQKQETLAYYATLGAYNARLVESAIKERATNDAKAEGLEGFAAMMKAADDTGKSIKFLVNTIDRLLAVMDSLYAIAKVTDLSSILPQGEGLSKFRAYITELGNALRVKNEFYANKPDLGLGGSGADSAVEKAKELSTALKEQVKSYQKATGSAAELNEKMRQYASLTTFVTGGSAAAAAELKKLGLSAVDAKAALDYNKEADLLTYVAEAIGGVDIRYKDLAKSAEKVKSVNIDSTKAFELGVQALTKLDGVTEEAAKAFMTKLLPALTGVSSGSQALQKEFEKLSEEAANLWAQWASPTGFDALVSKYKAIGGETTDLTIATVRAGKVFGDLFNSVQTESQKLAEASKLVEILSGHFDKTGLSAERLQQGLKLFGETLPTGALEKANEDLTNQIALLLGGADSLELYNAAWEATNGQLKDVTREFIKAKKENMALQKALAQIQEVRAIYESFGDGLARMFTDVFTGGIKSFSDFASRLKSLFKQMLSDLLFMAIKNSIFKAMFGGAGNTGGFWQALSGGGGGGGILGSLGSLFGGGGGLIGSAASMFAGSGPGQPGSFNPLGMFGNFAATSAATPGSPWFMGSTAAAAGSTGSGGFSLGPMLPYAGAALGGLFGLSNRGTHTGSVGSLAAGAAYGVGGWALGTAAYGGLLGASAGAATGLGLGATAGGAMSGALGAAGAIPVVGWIIAAIAAIDMITGGKVFGTRYRAESSTSTISTENQGSATVSLREVRQRALFGGRQWRNRSVTPGQELTDAAEQLYDSVYSTLADSANRLRSDVPPMIDAAVRTVVTYDSKGKVKATKIFVDILGRTWEEATNELAATRITGEAIIYAIDEALGYTVEQASASIADHLSGPDGVSDAVARGVGDVFEDITKTVDDAAAGTSGTIGEASAIAERWRDDAEALLDGATFLLVAATDMRNGISLFDDIGPGTLTRTADLIEELALANEPLQDAYIRVRDSVKLVEQTLGYFGVEAGKTREEFITFSAELVRSLGGIEDATTKLRAFSEAFGSIAGLNDYSATQNSASRARLLEGIGLSAETSATEFAAAFRAALPTMSAQEVGNWINAGMALVPIHNGLEALRIRAAGAVDPVTQITQEVDQAIEGLRVLGATEAELAQARIYGNQIIQQTIDQEAQAAEARRTQLNDFMSSIGEQLGDLGRTDYENQIEAVNRAMRSNILQATELGASYKDLSEIEALAAAQIQRINDQRAAQLSDFMNGIDGQLASFEGRSYIFQLAQINREMQANIRRASELGASLEQLARIQQLAAYQVTAAINELRNSISGLVQQLYGSKAQSQVQQVAATQKAYVVQQQEGIQETAQMAESASLSAKDYVRQEQVAIVNTGELELERYNAAQAAIKQIDEYLQGLQTSQLSPGGWRERLLAAQTNFQDIFQRAMQGDPEAMSQLTEAANTYLELAQQAYGPGVEYAQIFEQITAMLRQFQEYARTIPDPGTPGDPGGTGDPSGGGGSDSGPTEIVLTAQERYDLALQLAQNIGQLGLARDRSVFDLMDEYGIDLELLAQDLGIDIGHFTAAMGENLGVMAQALGISVSDLADALGLSSEALAAAFGVSITDFGAANLEALLAMSETLGTSIFETMSMVGIDLEALASSFGVDVNNLNAGMGERLIALSSALGVSLGELSEALGLDLSELAVGFGINLEELGLNTMTGLQTMAEALDMNVGELINVLGIKLDDLAVAFGIDLGNMSAEMFSRFVEFAAIIGEDIFSLAARLGENLTGLGDTFVQSVRENLATLPGVPEDIRAGLAPYLDDIENADNSADVVAGVSSLQTYVNSLPAGIRNSLNTLFESLGLTVTTAASTPAASTAQYQNDSLLAIRDTKAAVDTVTEAINNQGFTPVVFAINEAKDAIVAALSPVTVPPPPPSSSMANLDGMLEETRAFWRKEDEAASGSSESSGVYSSLSEAQAKALEEASEISAANAKNLEAVEDKLDEVVQVLAETLQHSKSSNSDQTDKLEKINKKLTQLNEKKK